MPLTPQCLIVACLHVPLFHARREIHARISTGLRTELRYFPFSKLSNPCRNPASGGKGGFPEQLPSFKGFPPIRASTAQSRGNKSLELVQVVVELQGNAPRCLAILLRYQSTSEKVMCVTLLNCNGRSSRSKN